MIQTIQKRCSNCTMFYPEDGCVDAVSFLATDGRPRAPTPEDCCGDHKMRRPVLRLVETKGVSR